MSDDLIKMLDKAMTELARKNLIEKVPLGTEDLARMVSYCVIKLNADTCGCGRIGAIGTWLRETRPWRLVCWTVICASAAATVIWGGSAAVQAIVKALLLTSGAGN